MAAGAGALGVSLGGAATYDGVPELRPPLGEGPAPSREDLDRAWSLVWRGVTLWLGALCMASAIAANGGETPPSPRPDAVLTLRSFT